MSKSTATTTPCCSKVGIKKGPWSAEEDEILSKFVQKEGEGRWRTLPKRAGLQRCGKSCRLRWMNYLRPSVKRGQIAPDEEDLILRLHRLLGNRWALIAGRLPGRTDNEIKNYWNTHLSKKLIKRGIDPRTHKPLITNHNSTTLTTVTTTSNGGVVHHHDQYSNVTSSIVMPLQQQPTMTVNPASEIGNVNNSKFDYVPIISAGGNIMEENNNVVVDDGNNVIYHHHGGNNGNNNNDVEEEDTLLVFLNSLFDGGSNEVTNNNNDNSGTDELAAFQHYHHHDHDHDHDQGDVTMFPPPLSTSFRLEDWEAEFSNALINQQDGSLSSSPPNK